MRSLLSAILVAVTLAGRFASGSPAKASTFVGSTSTAVFPPPGVSIVADDPSFPDASVVGFPGPTPTGDEAFAIATAPVIAKMNSEFPLVRPNSLGQKQQSSSSFDVLQNVGNLCPWQSVDSFGLEATPSIPQGCTLKQVHLTHRHGARYPTSDAQPASFAARIHAPASNGTLSASGALSFLNTWTYKLGAEILTPFGREQLFQLGVGFRVKYGELLKDFTSLPVFRTTSEARMVDSALHFAAGFFGVQTYQQDYHQLITVENTGQNNTLSPYDNCPNANNDIASFGGVQASKWAAIYLQPALKRLSPLVKGYQLTITDLIAMQQLCAYETVALGFSSFCGLFTQGEWESFEYFNGIFWYGNGPGNPAVAAQGIGYVQELVSRLTQTTISTFDTSVNASIVTNPTLFPLNQPIFVDATHDTILTAIFVAMNFTSLVATGPLPTDHIPPNRSYRVNQLAPFASNLVGQVLSCSPEASNATHIRWILNDGVMPLTGIKGCKANKDGLCDLQTFIKGMEQRLSEVDYQFSCFANYTIPNPDDLTTGQIIR